MTTKLAERDNASVPANPGVEAACLPPGDLVLEWVREPTALEALRTEWDGLLSRAEADNIFLTWEWVSTWWKHFGRGQDLWVFTLRDGAGRLRGLAPLKRSVNRGRFGTVRRIEFIGFGGAAQPDHLDFIHEKGTERACLEAVWDKLVELHAEWDLLYFTDLGGDSVTASLLREWVSSGRIRMHIYRKSVCPFVPLPDDFDQFLAGLPSNLRRDFRRNWRRLQKKFGAKVEAYETPGKTEEGLAELTRLHQLRMEDTDRGGNFANPSYREFHREVMDLLARRDWLEFKVMRLDDEPAVANYSFRYKGVLYGYQMGLDPKYYRYSLGTVLLLLMTQDLIGKGFHELDLLRGRSAWKYRWTDRERINGSFVVPRPGWRGRLAYWSDLLSYSPALVLQRLLPSEHFYRLQRWVRKIR